MKVVGESDEGYILGDSQSQLLDGSEGSEGDNIVEGEDGIGVILTTQKFLRCIERHLIVYLSASHHLAVYRYAMLPECFKISMLSPAHHIEVIRSADEGNPLATCLDKMICCHLSSLVSICSYRREFVGETCSAKEHEWNTHIGNFLKMGIVGGILSQTSHNTLHMHTDEVVDCPSLDDTILMTIGTYYRITSLGGLVLDTVEHGGIEVSDQVGHDNTDNLRSLVSQTARKGIRPVVQFLCQLLYSCLHLLSYFRTVSQCTTYGGDTDSKLLCEVFQ